MGEGLGLWLRRAREARKITIEDAERTLKIRRRYLQALEMGDYAALPGEIQARGFLRNYARFLNLPIEEALARYDAEVEGHPMQPRARLVPAEAKAPPLDRPTVFAPPDDEAEFRPGSSFDVPGWALPVLFGLLIFFALIGGSAQLYSMYGPQTLGAGNNPDPVQSPVAVASVPADSNPAFHPAPDGRVVVQLKPEEHAWVRVTADAYVVFEGVATPGQPVDAAAAEQVTVMTGNGGAFRLVVNGEDWGPLGAQGQSVRRAWSPTGEEVVEVP